MYSLLVRHQGQSSDLITGYFGANIHNSLQRVSSLNIKIIEPENERRGQNALSKRAVSK